MMRKLVTVLGLLALAIAMSSMTASAQVNITLGVGSADTVVFTSDGTNLDVTAGTCSVGVFSAVNSLCGSTTGTAGGSSVVGDFWEISGFSSAGVVLASNGKITQTSALAFSMGTTAGGSDLLTGNLQLLSFASVGSTGAFNENLVANLKITGGSLMSDFSPAGGIVTITIDLTSSTEISSLFGTAKGTSATVNYSSGELLATPEPGTLLLLGTGLLGLGGAIRRRFLAV